MKRRTDLTICCVIAVAMLFAPHPATGSMVWERIQDLNEYHANPGVVFYDGYIYVIGGGKGNCQFSDRVERLTPSGWEMMPSLVDAREAPIAGVVEDKIYVLGGGTSCTSRTDSIEVFDGTAWEKYDQMEFKTIFIAGIALCDTIYVFGQCDGDTGPCDYSQTWAYKPLAEGDRWERLEDPPALIDDIGWGWVTVMGGRIYALGLSHATEEIYPLLFDTTVDPPTWSIIGDPKPHTQGGGLFAGAEQEDLLVYAGGGYQDVPEVDVDVFCPETEHWEVYPPSGEWFFPRTNVGGIYYDGLIFMFGGHNGGAFPTEYYRIAEEGTFVEALECTIEPIAPCEPSVIAADIDIKPGSCPNPLNPKSKGVLPVALLGRDDFDVTGVDASTVMLEGITPVMWHMEDSSSPPAGQEACTCDGTEGPDGYVDMVLHFDTQELVENLGIQDGPEGEAIIPVTLVGEHADGPFIGQDCMVVRFRAKDEE